MADAVEYGPQNQCRKCIVFRPRSATVTQHTTHSQTARRSCTVSAAVCDSGTGREQPSGPASGRQWVQNRGVAHAPAASVTPAKCVSCAAQNVALVVPLLSGSWRYCRLNPGLRTSGLISGLFLILSITGCHLPTAQPHAAQTGPASNQSDEGWLWRQLRGERLRSRAGERE
jgi:hypothetical protein